MGEVDRATDTIIDKQIHADEIKLRILLTNGCTRACAFCLNDFQPKPERGKTLFLDRNVAEASIAYYASTLRGRVPLQVYFSGGEPTLHPDLPRLMAFARKLDCRVTLNTNGDFGSDVERALIDKYDQIHFGVYAQNAALAERIARMNGSCQTVAPPATEGLVAYYVERGLQVKIFKNFFDAATQAPRTAYQDMAYSLSRKYKDFVSFRHTGAQQNRGAGCGGCKRRCITLRALWVFPDGGVSPCPQLVVPKERPRCSSDWSTAYEALWAYYAREALPWAK